MVLVDTEGVVVTTEQLERYGNLILVVGDEAPKHTAELLGVLDGQPALRRRVQSAVWVSGRRWDVHLDDGILVELPETGTAQAWARLADIERDHALLAREIVKVDLRLADRVVVHGPADPARSPAARPAAKPGTKPT
jgi:cell division protein FtsQ